MLVCAGGDILYSNNYQPCFMYPCIRCFMKYFFYSSFIGNLIGIIVVWFILSEHQQIAVRFNAEGRGHIFIYQTTWLFSCMRQIFAVFVLFLSFFVVYKLCPTVITKISFPNASFWKSEKNLPMLRKMAQSFVLEVGAVVMLSFLYGVICFTLIPNLRIPPQLGNEFFGLLVIMLIFSMYPIRLLRFWYYN